MGDRFPGGVISKTPPEVVPPVGGEGGSASGVWTLAEQLDLQKAGFWPQGILPRELYAWGNNGFGQLGIGTAFPDSRSSPTQIGALTDWGSVALLGYGTQGGALKRAGTLWLWGRNQSGQLGQNNIVDSSSPVQVGALTDWALVSTGDQHTAAIKTAGSLWTWGQNNAGQLGLNTQGFDTYRSSPVQVGSLTNWAQVSVGTARTLAVKTDGTLWAWGANTFGEIGNNSTLNRSSPVQIGSLTNWKQVVTSTNHSSAITTGGQLYAWGSNSYGRLGDGTVVSKSSPVQIGVLTNWSQVASSGSHTLSVKTDNTLWAWGRNTNGRLGDGTVVNKSSPVQIGILVNWAAVAGSGESSAAVKTDGTLWSWGRNQSGELGLGDVTSRSSPVQVGASTNWEQIQGGASHFIAITKGP
jgi:alpha-tubulin suppressor-like RCC1 family protein